MVRYRANSQGTRELMNSKMVGDAMGSVAADMASQANTVGRGSYESRQVTVSGGWSNTQRAGAEVVETVRYWPDVRDRVLVNLSNQYRMRGGG